MQKICFNKNWKFAKGNIPFNYWGNWRINADSQRNVTLPHDFMVEEKRDKNSLTQRDGGYFPGGVGYYSKSFFVEENSRDKKFYVEFEGVYMNSFVKLNGNLIKRQNYGYTTFFVDLSEYIKPGEENLIEVVADNSAVPNSRWYSGSGIYRYVWLYETEKNHINFNGVYIKTKSVGNGSAVLTIDADICRENPGDITGDSVEHVIKDAKTGEIIAEAKYDCGNNRSVDIEIKNPKIWDIDSPDLYIVTTNYYMGGVLADTAETTYGIRSFSIDSKNGFILNGRQLKLKGGCIHHDNGILGSASYFRSEERKIEILKKSGFNAVRCAHNPPAPAFLDACDRLGMLVMDEAFDIWRCSKTQYDYHMVFDTDWEHDLISMILRDRNHPSVVLWSTGNEIVEQTGNSGAAKTSAKLAETIRKYDDRPVGMAIMGYDKTNQDNIKGVNSVVETLDFVGYNYQHGDYESDKAKYPDRVIIGTETVPKDIYHSWEATLKNQNVIGDFVWTAVDYLGEAGIGRVYYTEERPDIEARLYDYPWNQAYCGDIDVCGFKRAQSYYRDILWGVSDKPKMFARRPSKYSHESEKVTYWGWNDCIEGWDFDISENTPVIVDIYSPAQSVELFLNGESLGVNDLAELKTSFKVDYKKGELKAVDSNKNTVILSSSKTPVKIKLAADREKIDSKGDLSYITVEIADIDGKTVTNAENTVYFSVEGPGTLVAAGSSNPKTEEMYSGNFHSAYDGKLMAVVRADGEGEIKLTAISDKLEKAEIVIFAG
ncbi:MAG: DUF4982 domain-containing protein [Oscillospiraceae bacterium]|nr:DUF4982 domain-containing protein [Oscillospiraceae bacterium]